MLTYKLESFNGEKYIYIYYPEGNKKHPGKVAFYTDGSREIISNSLADEIGWYRLHAFSGIEVGKSSGTVIWY